MSLANDKWKSPAWQFQTKAQAHEDLLGSKSDETDGVVDVAGLYVASYGTALAGLGAGLTFDIENGAGEVEERASIDVVATTVTNGSEDFDMNFNVSQGGTVTKILGLDASGPTVVVTGGLTVSGTLAVTGATTESAAKTITVDNASNNAVTDILNLSHSTSGTPAAGLGVGLVFKGENATPAVIEIASIDAVYTDVTAGAEYADIVFNVITNGSSLELMRLDSSTDTVSISGNLATTGTSTVTVDNATTNAVTDVLTLAHTTSGTPANGIGTGISFQTENATPATLQIASIDATLTDVTAGAEYGDLIFSAMINNTVTEVLRIDGSLGMLDIKDPGTDSSIDPSATAESDWLEIRLGGVQKFIPLYAAS